VLKKKSQLYKELCICVRVRLLGPTLKCFGSTSLIIAIINRYWIKIIVWRNDKVSLTWLEYSMTQGSWPQQQLLRWWHGRRLRQPPASLLIQRGWVKCGRQISVECIQLCNRLHIPFPLHITTPLHSGSFSPEAGRLSNLCCGQCAREDSSLSNKDWDAAVN
jgi:hypothetical protein